VLGKRRDKGGHLDSGDAKCAGRISRSPDHAAGQVTRRDLCSGQECGDIGLRDGLSARVAMQDEEGADADQDLMKDAG